MEPIAYIGPLFVFVGVILVFWSLTRSSELDPEVQHAVAAAQLRLHIGGGDANRAWLQRNRTPRPYGRHRGAPGRHAAEQRRPVEPQRLPGDESRAPSRPRVPGAKQR